MFLLHFHIDDTFEMRTSVCISIDELRMLTKVFISNGKKSGREQDSEETERERERESVCVCVSVDNSNSVG